LIEHRLNPVPLPNHAKILPSGKRAQVTFAIVISVHQFLSFAVAALLIIVIPGPSVLFVISRGVAFGRRAALATVLGNTVGAGVQGLFVVFGLGALVTRSIVIYNVVKFGGAIYLVYLGWTAFRNRKSLAVDQSSVLIAKPARQIVREGFVVGISNPKIIVFFTATLPQFIERDRGSVTLQMLSLLGIFCSVGLISDGLWGLVSGSVRGWFSSSPKRLEALVGGGGLAIMGLGIRLAIAQDR
jgi:threonine/homoserine/homoserine lactone efflux protein